MWPDLTLLDLNLPGTSGIELLETIRQEELLRRIPVIVLSSSTASQDIEQSYENNANAYLTKPSTPTEYFSLANTVEQFWLETAQLPPTPS